MSVVVAALSLSLVASVALPVAADSETTAGVTRHHKMERLALKLLNCTRTGGWVRKDGSCRNRGSGRHSAYRKPLARHKPITNRVAYPWATQMVRTNQCAHVIEGQPGLSARMKAAGYPYWNVGENIGCTWGYSLKAAIIWSHRAMQAEKSYQGGHWRNMKRQSYKSVGIGVARSDGMIAIVFDFYGRKAP
jgi:hypothetical protein